MKNNTEKYKGTLKFHNIHDNGTISVHMNVGYVCGRWGILKSAVAAFLEMTSAEEDEVNVVEITSGSPNHTGCTFLSAAVNSIPEGFEKLEPDFWTPIRN